MGPPILERCGLLVLIELRGELLEPPAGAVTLLLLDCLLTLADEAGFWTVIVPPILVRCGLLSVTEVLEEVAGRLVGPLAPDEVETLLVLTERDEVDFAGLFETETRLEVRAVPAGRLLCGFATWTLRVTLLRRVVVLLRPLLVGRYAFGELLRETELLRLGALLRVGLLRVTERLLLDLEGALEDRDERLLELRDGELLDLEDDPLERLLLARLGLDLPPPDDFDPPPRDPFANNGAAESATARAIATRAILVFVVVFGETMTALLSPDACCPMLRRCCSSCCQVTGFRSDHTCPYPSFYL
jgi:hypothetical protein